MSPTYYCQWLRPIWQASDYACGRRLVAMLPEWIPAYEQHEKRLPGEMREKLLLANIQVQAPMGSGRFFPAWLS